MTAPRFPEAPRRKTWMGNDGRNEPHHRAAAVQQDQASVAFETALNS
jgi:hypothetical protein